MRLMEKWFYSQMNQEKKNENPYKIIINIHRREQETWCNWILIMQVAEIRSIVIIKKCER